MQPEQQAREDIDRLLSIAREAEIEVEDNLKRMQALRQAILARAFQPVRARRLLITSENGKLLR